jgi:tetratricopeptide (TPR) repeat protein
LSKNRKPHRTGKSLNRSDEVVADIRATFDDALRHHQAGRQAEAERLFKLVVTAEPRHADSQYFLGLIAFESGRYDAAVDRIGQAIRIKEGIPFYHYTLGNALRSQGKVADAVAQFERALTLKPDYVEAHNNLGVILSEQGKRDEAIGHYRSAVAIRPDSANAHSNLGTELGMQGKVAEAMIHLERAVALDPGHANAHNNLGLALAGQGRFADAIAHYERALELNPGYADAHNNLGTALAAQGRVADAIVHYERALALYPRHANAHNNLGLALGAQGRFADAVAHYERALELNPDRPDPHSNLGLALAAQGRMADAIAHYERALELNPRHVNAHNNLGTALMAQGRNADAIAHLERALAVNPDHADLHNNLGVALIGQGRVKEAIAHYERVLVLRPNDANAHSNLGTALAEQGRIAEAMSHLERALAANPDHADAHNSLGNIFKDEGKLDDAMAHYVRAIAIRPDFGEAHLNRADIKSYLPGDADLPVLEALAGRHDLPASTAMRIHFALGKAFEDTGDYARAWEHLLQGNGLKRKQIDYDEAKLLDLFERVSTVFDKGLLDRFLGEGEGSPVPVFVLGMPRSGSSLIEQILASHPQIHGAGELMDFEAAASAVFHAGGRAAEYPECTRAVDGAGLRRIGQSYLARLPSVAGGKVRIVDKLPGNFLNIGLIRLALPNARIIHTMRHPMDTCVSCYSKLFTFGHHYTYDLAELGRFYRYYDELMTHWRRVLPPGAILDVSYEQVVGDLEGQARRMIEYCGLPWDDRCISFHKTRRPVKTASSVQVRKPLFRSSLQRWRRYESGVTPLLAELEKILPDLAPLVSGANGAHKA